MRSPGAMVVIRDPGEHQRDRIERKAPEGLDFLVASRGPLLAYTRIDWGKIVAGGYPLRSKQIGERDGKGSA